MTEKIQVAKIPVHLFTVESLHQTILDTIKRNNKRIFLHANARLIELANTKEKWLVNFFNAPNTFVMCDGAGVQLAAKLSGQAVPMKIPYNIWIWDFVKFLAKNGFKLYLIGADEYTLNRAYTNLKKSEPDLNIVGRHHGYFRKQQNDAESLRVIEDVNASKADVVLIGFGMPVQERWVLNHYEQLNTPAIFTCGGAFDFIAGKNPVAPKIFRVLYLEWLFRFLQEPVRLFSRATISNLKFLAILAASFKDKKSGK